MSIFDIPHIPRKRLESRDPKKIGLWKIGRIVGEGSSGRVRIARHSKTGQYAAVKIISKTSAVLTAAFDLQQAAEDAELDLQAAEREIVIMKLIDHPNVLRLYDVWETSTDLYLVLEYAEGGELLELIHERGRLQPGYAMRFFHQTLVAVDYCHRFNITHRDLKPDNLLLDKDMNIKVADFGLASWHAGSRNDLLGTFCGSPQYAAPELLAHEPYIGSAVDVWSLGIILYTMLVGKLPYVEEDDQRRLNEIESRSLSFPSFLADDARDLISKMLTRHPHQRLSIRQIKDHPYYVSHGFADISAGGVLSSGLANVVQHSTTPIREIDPAILANIQTLSPHTPSHQLLRSLKSEGANWTKSVYRLLVKFRTRHARSFDDHDATPGRFAKTPSSHEQEGERRPHSPIPPRSDAPTPTRARRKETFAGDDTRSFEPPYVPSFNIDRSAAVSTPPRVLSDADMSPATNHVVQMSLHQQINDSLNSMQKRAVGRGSTVPAALDTIRESSQSQLEEDCPTPATIIDSIFGGSSAGYSTMRTDAYSPMDAQFNREQVSPASRNLLSQEVDKENRVPQSSKGKPARKSSMRKGNAIDRGNSFARRVQIVEPKKLTKGRGGTSALTYDSDEALHSQTKTNHWLSSLLRLKPTTLTLLSVHDVHTSREECRRLLVNIGAHVALKNAQSTSILRCKVVNMSDPTRPEGALKPVRFRVEMRQPTREQRLDGYHVALKLVMEKGDAKTFKAIIDRIEMDWDLHEVKTPSPATTPSPALAELDYTCEIDYK